MTAMVDLSWANHTLEALKPLFFELLQKNILRDLFLLAHSRNFYPYFWLRYRPHQPPENDCNGRFMWCACFLNVLEPQILDLLNKKYTASTRLPLEVRFDCNLETISQQVCGRGTLSILQKAGTEISSSNICGLH